MNDGRRPRIFYGWIIVAACMLVQGATFGVIGSTLSVFIRPVSEALAIPRATFTAYTAFGMVTNIVMSPIWGEYFKTHRFIPAMLIGSTVVGGGIFFYSFASKYWHFYLISAINGVFNGMLMGIPLSSILSNWFIDRRGTATGIAFSGSGIAAMIMAPIASRVVQNMGWQWGYRLLAIVFWCMTIPTLLFVMKEKPADMGLLPLGAEKAGEAEPAEMRLDGMTRAQALRSKTFWTYAASLLLIGIFCFSVQNNTIAHLSDVGYSATYAAGVFSACMGVLTVGKIVLGMVYDKFGMTVGTVYLSIASIAGIGCLIAAKGSHLPAVGYVVIFGFGNAIQTVPIAYMTRKLFGTREYSRIYGICQPAYSMGTAVGVPLSAAVRDMYGSYVPGFFASIVCAVVVLLLMCASVRFAPKELARFEEINEKTPAGA